MKGLSYNKNKPTRKREELSLPLATFFCCCMTSSLRGKKPREKVQSIFHLPWKQIFNYEHSLYNFASPDSSLFFWSMLSGMTNNPRVKKCLITGTHLPHSKAQLRRVGWGWGCETGGKQKKKKPKTKNPTTEEPYGIDIRQRARALKPFLLERKKNWHKFFQKEITPNQSNPAL